MVSVACWPPGRLFLPTLPDIITRCQPWLGTFVEISVARADVGAIGDAFATVALIHRLMSFHDGASDLARLRSAQPGKVVKVDRETVSVLRLAIMLHGATHGLFDVAVGRALVRGRFLPRDGIAHLGCFTGTTADIEVIDDHHVRCRRRVLIDLGGIAKGHAVDRAVEVLQASGVKAGLVNAGGDLRAFGPPVWPIGLRDADGAVRRQLNASDCAVASSANLLNRHRVRGQWHSPHLNREGLPILSGQRTTVVAETCAIADAMTKVAMAEPELADAILGRFKGYILHDLATPETA